MQNGFRDNSIVVLNIKYRVKKQSIKSIFSRFGIILKIKTFASKNNTLMAFIKYEDNDAIQKALEYGEIRCCGIPLVIRKAYEEERNRKNCKCLICDGELQAEFKKVQKCLFESIKQLHEANIKPQQINELKEVKRELKAINKRLYRQIKSAISH